jgi:hypothetical protein
VAPTEIFGVSSGGVDAAAGVTCAAQGAALMSATAIVLPSRRRTVECRLFTQFLLRKPIGAGFHLRHGDVSSL